MKPVKTETSDEWNYFDKAIRKYPTVLWTHTADMIASKVKDIKSALPNPSHSSSSRLGSR